jgi:hypothetical protein
MAATMFGRNSRCAFYTNAAFPRPLPSAQPIIFEDHTDALLEEARLVRRARELAARLVEMVDGRARSKMEALLLIESPAPLRVLASRFLFSHERFRRLEDQILRALRAEVARPENPTTSN